MRGPPRCSAFDDRVLLLFRPRAGASARPPFASTRSLSSPSRAQRRWTGSGGAERFRPPAHSAFSPQTAVISRGKAGIVGGSSRQWNRRFAGISSNRRRVAYYLPCRRSRVRVPSAASQKACICRSFSCAQSAGASASPDNDWTIVSVATRGRGRKVLFSRRFRATSTLELLRPCRRSRVDRGVLLPHRHPSALSVVAKLPSSRSSTLNLRFRSSSDAPASAGSAATPASAPERHSCHDRRECSSHGNAALCLRVRGAAAPRPLRA
jgi:hypothetical protein